MEGCRVRLIIAIGLLFTSAAGAATYTVSQVSFTNCGVCGNKIDNGDTYEPTFWAATGSHIVNGVTVTGDLFGFLNDTNIFFRADPQWGPNCGGGNNLIWFQVKEIDTINGTANRIDSKNCMSSFGAAPGDRAWPPAASGTCYNGDTGSPNGGCDWKTVQGICDVDGTGEFCVAQVYRQGRNDGNPPFRGYDSTLILTRDKGVTWSNPHHVGVSTNANGDAPPGPGDANYASSMMWQDPAPHNGLSNHVGRLMFVTYGRAGATWPSADNNSTYIYAISYDGSFSQLYAHRALRANLANLSAADWTHYKCATYPSPVCDGADSANWDADPSNSTSISNVGITGLGGVTYIDTLGIYVMSGGFGVGGNGTVPIISLPHPWGPLTVIGTMNGNPAASAQLVFVVPVLSTLQTLVAGHTVQFGVSSTSYSFSGSGNPSYVTYQISDIPPSQSHLGGTVTIGGKAAIH